MKAIRRLTFLGLFAAAGIGLAISVGLSTSTPIDQSESSAAAADAEGVESAAAKSSVASPPRPTYLVPSQPILTAPQQPTVVEPYPAVAQQVVPGVDAQQLQQIQDYVRRSLNADSAVAANQPTPPPSIEPPPPGDVAPTEVAAPVPPVEPASPKASVNGTGSGRVSIHIQDEEIRAVLDLLSEEGQMNILAAANVQGKVSATLNNVTLESALDAILKSTGYTAKREGDYIFVGTPADFDTLEQALDKVGTRIYRPNYITSAELQALVTPMLTPDIGVVSVSSPSEAGIGSDSAAAGGDAYAGGDVLLVRDYEAALAEIDQMVRSVDIRPLQVAIEAMILSVKLKDENKMGVDFELIKDNLKFGLGFPPDNLADVKFDAGGLKFAYFDGEVGVFVDALETIGDTNVIATPRLMVLNKHRAEIQIGEKKGYVSTTQTETVSTQSVEFLDTGAQLRLRPFISSDGIIRMEVHPELSDGDVKVEQGFTLPNKEVTEVTTNIMVRDGCTVIIGGLMREQLLNSTTQVPLFGSLPLLGYAFRNTTETTERREVLVLITPRIVYEPGTCAEGEAAACEFHRRQDVYREKMSPLGKRSIARCYFRLAQNAWALGDRRKALRFAEMAVHFDPLSRAAIDLRSDIWLGKPHGNHTLGAGTAMDATVAVSPLDGQEIAPWLLNDLQQEPVVQPSPLHPLDPGQPGTSTDIVRPRRFQ